MTTLRLAAWLLATTLLAGCGGESGDNAGPAAAPNAPPAQAQTAPPAASATADQDNAAAASTLPPVFTASNVTFYYQDLRNAEAFYTQTLGLQKVADYGDAVIVQLATTFFITLVDANTGPEHARAPKTTAIALVTDELDGWWDYISSQDVELRSKRFDPQSGSAHDGFVALDPEGYLLEFERFNAHPENVDFVPVLEDTPSLSVTPGAANERAALGFKAGIVWFYYRDMQAIQDFYRLALDFKVIVDQGWTKIYRIGPSGYLGVVDEARGMHKYTETKAVILSMITDDVDAWFQHIVDLEDITVTGTDISADAHQRGFLIRDTGNYFLGIGTFKDSAQNQQLLSRLAP